MIFKSRRSSGFSLMEVLAAIAIFAIVMSPLFILQSAAYGRLVKGAVHLKRIWAGQDYLYTTRQDIRLDMTNYTVQISQEMPKTVLQYNLTAPQENSPFVSMKDVYVESVFLKWQEGYDSLITFQFKPQPKKQEKK